MTTGPDALILHQYEISPFSEKVRVAMGIKGTYWHACNQPAIMPKPEMVRLTGGFRRIPVLQVGADLYFDSQLIIEELDRRAPSPSAFAGSGIGVAGAFARWSDGELFMAVVGLLFGGDWDYDAAFLADRSTLIGQAFDPEQMAAAATGLVPQLRMHLDLVETQLADGRAFLMGEQADAVDAAVYCQVLFIRWGKGRTAKLLEDFPLLCAWAKRVGALGHGDRQRDVEREEAIEIARAATPAPIAAGSDDLTFSPGDAVSVRYHDANTPVLEGTLLRIDRRSLTLRPDRSEAGEIHIHMPRTVGALSKR